MSNSWHFLHFICRTGRPLVETSTTSSPQPRCLYYTHDLTSGSQFLVDTDVARSEHCPSHSCWTVTSTMKLRPASSQQQHQDQGSFPYMEKWCKCTTYRQGTAGVGLDKGRLKHRTSLQLAHQQDCESRPKLQLERKNHHLPKNSSAFWKSVTWLKLLLPCWPPIEQILQTSIC